MTRFITVALTDPDKRGQKTGTASGLAIVRRGLALHRTVSYGIITINTERGPVQCPMFNGQGWTITHIQSGLSINRNPIHRADQARDIFRLLLGEGIPWERPHTEFTPAQRRIISTAVDAYGLR
jgi:hypothetical protein